MCRRPPVIRCRHRHLRQRRPASAARVGCRAGARAPSMPVNAEAYACAARVAEVENPNCKVAWTTLAGIGMMKPSRHLPGRDDRSQQGRHAADPGRAARRHGGQSASPTPTAASSTAMPRSTGRWAHAVHPRDVGAFRGGRQQRRRGEPGPTSTTPRCRTGPNGNGYWQGSGDIWGWSTLKAYNSSSECARARCGSGHRVRDRPPALTRQDALRATV